jgi:hypothetical protein
MPPCDTYDAEKLIESSARDGWVLGYVGTPWPGPWPKRNGDLFVADPEGWQAGIAWESTGSQIEQVVGATAGRWGVFQVLFPLLVMSEQDLVRNFHLVLPALKEQRERVGARSLS